jgi:hypothetical protein
MYTQDIEAHIAHLVAARDQRQRYVAAATAAAHEQGHVAWIAVDLAHIEQQLVAAERDWWTSLPFLQREHGRRRTRDHERLAAMRAVKRLAPRHTHHRRRRHGAGAQQGIVRGARARPRRSSLSQGEVNAGRTLHRW